MLIRKILILEFLKDIVLDCYACFNRFKTCNSTVINNKTDNVHVQE